MARFLRVTASIDGFCCNTGKVKTIPNGVAISLSSVKGVSDMRVVHWGLYALWVPIEDLEGKTMPLDADRQGAPLFIVRTGRSAH